LSALAVTLGFRSGQLRTFAKTKPKLVYFLRAKTFHMSITATVEAGKITLPPDVNWPSGTVVRIEPVDEQPATLWEAFKQFDGIADDLPADLAANLDHYVHGHPR